MKPSPALPLLLLLVAGGLYLGWRGGRAQRPLDEHAAVAAPSGPRDTLTGPEGGSAPASRERAPAAGPLSLAPEPDSAADEAARAAALAAWRAREAAEREERIAARQLEAREWTRQRSIRFANELDLPPGSELRIAEILLEADERLALVREQALALGSNPAGRTRLIEGAAEVRAWRDERFEALFGPDLARRILALEDNETDLGKSPERPPDPEEELRDDERQD